MPRVGNIEPTLAILQFKMISIVMLMHALVPIMNHIVAPKSLFNNRSWPFTGQNCSE